MCCQFEINFAGLYTKKKHWLWVVHRVVIIAIFSNCDKNNPLDQNKKLRSVSRSIMKFFGQFASITRQLSLGKSVSIEIALTAQVSFTFFLEYCRCFSECKMASKSNCEEVSFIDFCQH